MEVPPRFIALELLPPSPADSPAPHWTGSSLKPPSLTPLDDAWIGSVNLLLSTASHIAFMAVASAVGPWLADEFNHTVQIRPQLSTTVEVRLPLYLPSRPPEGASEKSAGSKSKPGPPAPPASKPAFELPPIPPRKDVELTLLQPPPEIEVPIPKDLKVPPIMSWSQPVKIKAPPKKFVMPGVKAPNPEIPQLDAPPRLDPPNRQAKISDIKMAADPVMTQPPKLAIERASTMPVRTFVPPRERQPNATAALDPFQGDNLNLVAISPASKAPLDRIKIPAGVQVAAIHQIPNPTADRLGDPSAKGSASGDPSASGPGNGQESRAAGADGAGAGPNTGGAGLGAGKGTGKGTGNGAGKAAGTGTGSGSGSGAQGSGSGADPNGKGPGGSGTGTGNTLAAGASNSNPTTLDLIGGKPPIRIEHPESRSFDVVVVQSSNPDGASGAGILSGSPIHTVYVPVGRQKPWIMQYCVPKESAIKARKGIAIQLGNPAPVKAPFPRITVVPPLPGTERIVLHGFVTDLGEFRDLRVVAGADIADQYMIVPLLKRWIFRPATRDGAPVTVEVVIVMPRDQV